MREDLKSCSSAPLISKPMVLLSPSDISWDDLAANALPTDASVCNVSVAQITLSMPRCAAPLRGLVLEMPCRIRRLTRDCPGRLISRVTGGWPPRAG